MRDPIKVAHYTYVLKMAETMQAEDVSSRDGSAWVRLPLATLNGLLDQRFKSLEQETRQLRDELAQTHAALATVHTGMIRMSAELRQQSALDNEQLRNEIKQITAALAGLKDGATVTLRTSEVTFAPKQPAPTPTETILTLPAGAAVVDGSVRSASRPRPPGAQGSSVPFKKPTYASPPPPPSPTTGAAQSVRGAPASRASHPPPPPSLNRSQAEAPKSPPLPPSAAKVRSLSDRLLRMLGVSVPVK